MPLTSKGAEILKAMEKTYGSEEKAKSVLFASSNAGKITGIDAILDCIAKHDRGSFLDSVTRSDAAKPEMVAKVLNLYNRPGTPGEKQAAAEALRRMGWPVPGDVPKDIGNIRTAAMTPTKRHFFVDLDGPVQWSFSVAAENEKEAIEKAMAKARKSWDDEVRNAQTKARKDLLATKGKIPWNVHRISEGFPI